MMRRDGTKLRSIARRAIDELNLPDVHVESVTVKHLASPRFLTDARVPCYVVTVRTNNPAALRGSATPYKGSYKERIEGAMQLALSAHGVAMVHVDIVGRTPGKLDRAIPIEKLVRTGEIPGDSPLVRTALHYGIPCAQYHGRHLVGPSPAVAQAVHRHVRSRGGCRSLLDLYAGTGIASAVVSTVAEPKSIVVVDSDPVKLTRMRTYLKGPVSFIEADATTFRLRTRFDLVVADPYYETAMTFWNRWEKVDASLVGHLIFVSGNIEDVEWNRLLARRVRQAGWRITVETLFGQVIYSGTRV